MKLRWFRESLAVRVFAGFTLAALALGALGWLVTGPYRGSAAALDSTIRTSIRQMQSPMWSALFLAVTKLGSTFYLTLIGTAAGIVFIFFRLFRSLLLLIIIMAGQAALHHGFKWLFARPRPANLISYRAAETSSFPSGHAIAALCLYGIIAWVVAREIENPAVKAGVWMLTTILVFLIGMSRVYIGIHYPTDVLAGFLAGLIWIAAVLSADRKPL